MAKRTAKLVSRWRETQFRSSDVSRAQRGISIYQILSHEILQGSTLQDTSLALSRQGLVIMLIAKLAISTPVAAQELFPVNQTRDEAADSSKTEVSALNSVQRTIAHEAGGEDLVKPVRLTLAASFQSKGGRIYLSDLCQCLGEAAACADALGLDVGPAPEPGATISIYRNEIEKMLSLEFPNRRYGLEGASVTRISGTVMKITADDVSQALSSLLQKRFGSVSEYKFELRSISLDRQIKLAPASVRFYFPSIENEVDDNLLAIQFMVPRKIAIKAITDASVQYDKGSELNFNAFIQFKIYRRVPVAAVNLKAKQVLSEELFSTQWLEWRSNYSGYLTDTSKLAAFRLKRSVGAGQPIRSQDLVESSLVRRNQEIQLVIEGSGLSLGGKAKALSEGAAGEPIEVEVIATKKKVTAIVIDSNSASLRL